MKQNAIKVAIVYTVFLVLAIVAVVRIVDLQFFDKDIKFKEYRTKTSDVVEVAPIRGSILAADGRPLAFSTPWYAIGIDPTVQDSVEFEKNIAALSKALADNYHQRSAEEYEKTLRAARQSNKKYVKLLKKPVSYDEMKAIAQYPLFCLGREKGGYVKDPVDHREYPYGRLAYRALGYLRSDSNEPPKIGVEAAMDSVLRGTPGLRPIRKIDKGWIPDVEKKEIPAVDGQDIQISIDIDIQDIAQRALLRKIENEPDLEAGTVIVMEVATGEIRAMVNMEKDQNGKFSEQYNYAIGRLGEPGSVFKLATLVTALEDKKVTLDSRQSADVNWYYGKTKFEDTYLRNYNSITIRKGLEISSNNVFRRLAAEKYGHNPQDFVDKLNNVRRITYNYDFDLPGMGKARIRDPKDKLWSPSDLPQIGMGYAVQLTPLHILSFYNAIANNGVMVKPHLYVNLQRGGQIEYTYPVETIGRVCSEETAALAREALRGVVIGENGTARHAFAHCKVPVAGKTGTARVALGHGYVDGAGRKKHQGSFVGFFPYENPKYSIIVAVYSRLSTKNFYGGSWGGPVACEIIDNMYASSPDWGTPTISAGALPEIAEVAHRAQNDTASGVPNVIGMGLRDAVYLLESQGYKVEATGHGKIVDQNPKAGAMVNRDTNCVTLSLAQRL